VCCRRATSTKTRIETYWRPLFKDIVIDVEEQHPLKQGLKLGDLHKSTEPIFQSKSNIH